MRPATESHDGLAIIRSLSLSLSPSLWFCVALPRPQAAVSVQSNSVIVRFDMFR